MAATDPCTVLIAAPESLPALRSAAGARLDGDVVEFADTDALKALEVITLRRPDLVFVESTFANTARGTALVKRIKADPTLAQSIVHVIHTALDGAGDPLGVSEGAERPAEPVSPPSLDRWGTRRAERYPIAGRVEVALDGKPVLLVNLSTVGAQVVSATVLRPNQRIRVAFIDAHGVLRFNAAVAWAAFEIDQAEGPRYRAGLEFLDADRAAIDAYCARHREA